MKATELVGKNAIRTQPIMEEVATSMGIFSTMKERPVYAYTQDPIKILKATDHHIVFEREWLGVKKTSILDCRYCDNNWIDYDELMNLEPQAENIDKDSIDK